MEERVEMTTLVTDRQDLKMRYKEDYVGDSTLCLRMWLRRILLCYNVCVFIIGCGSLGVGVWLVVMGVGSLKEPLFVENQLYDLTLYLLIAGGGVLVLVAISGCYAIIQEDPYILSYYSTVLAIALFVFGVATGLSFFSRDLLVTQMGANIEERMRHSLTEQYGINVLTDPENKRITDAWDAMQRQFGCCGISGNASSTDSWVYYSFNTLWYTVNLKKTSQKLQKVPVSCCKNGDEAICTGQVYFPGPPNHLNSPLEQYSKTNPDLYTTGCYDQLLNYLDHLKVYPTVTGSVCAAVSLFLISGIIISYCLCARVSGT